MSVRSFPGVIESRLIYKISVLLGPSPVEPNFFEKGYRKFDSVRILSKLYVENSTVKGYLVEDILQRRERRFSSKDRPYGGHVLIGTKKSKGLQVVPFWTLTNTCPTGSDRMGRRLLRRRFEWVEVRGQDRRYPQPGDLDRVTRSGISSMRTKTRVSHSVLLPTKSTLSSV